MQRIKMDMVVSQWRIIVIIPFQRQLRMSFHKWANVLAVMWTCIWTAKRCEEWERKNCERRLWECGGPPAGEWGGGVDTIIASPEKKNAILYSVCARTSVLNVKQDVFSPQTETESSFSRQISDVTTLMAGFVARLTQLDRITRCLIQSSAVVLWVGFFPSKSIANILNMSSCQRVRCVRREHDRPGCSAASLSQKSINCTNRERHTTWQQPGKIRSNYFCARSAAVVFKKETPINICQR